MIAMRNSLTIVMFIASILVRKLDCHLSKEESEEEMKRLFLIDFKKRLMEKLGMKEEPKNVADDLPTPIIDAMAKQDLSARQLRLINDKGNKISHIVLKPFHAKANISDNTYSIKFHVVPTTKVSYRVTGVNLWLYVKNSPAKTHWFRIYEKTRWGRRLVLHNSISSFNSDWVEFKLVQNKVWCRTPWKTLHLEIEGINDKQNKPVFSTKDNQPRLQLSTRPTRQRRLKRTVSTTTDDCSPDGRCCKHLMTLNLKRQLPWVVHPAIFQARICLGSCPLLHRTRWSWSVLTQVQQSREPCCVPTKVSPVSYIYTDQNGNYLDTTLDDMQVDSCGCT